MIAARHKGASGQVLPLFAILVPGMLALMALGLDAAQIFLERRDAQSAADLAAVAGAKQLPTSDIDAEAEAEAVGIANGFTAAQVKPNAAFGTPNQIEVVIDTEVDTFFMSILGFFGGGSFDKVDVSARAVAQQKPSAESHGTYALFSLQPCGSEKDYLGIEWSGNENLIEGSVHSSSGVTIPGNENVIEEEFSVTCVGKTGTPSNLRISDKYPYNEYGDNPALPTSGELVPPDCTGTEDPGEVCRQEVPTPDIPFYDEVTKTLDSVGIDAACTVKWTGDKDVIPADITGPGVYCALNGKMVIKKGTYNNVTFFAREFDVADSYIGLLSSFRDDILMYATTTEEGKGILYSGNYGVFNGYLFSPMARSTVGFSGEGNTVNGALVGYSIKYNGNKSTLTGTFGTSDDAPPTVALIE